MRHHYGCIVMSKPVDAWRADRDFLLRPRRPLRVAFRRNAAGEWVLRDMTDAALLQLPCIGVEVAMADVFDGVAPDAAGAG